MTTERDMVVLAHVLLNPEEWVAHVRDTFGEDADSIISEKVNKYAAAYDAAVEAGNYQNRAQREENL